ncbi:MAG: hypothetical protein BWY45_03346 [Euryarchaeota archaeon ADurb.Bin294]|nr:MAG: hypothetical protein BWY45_03346 [Euryarchaeota archaeon ADurb.Bin294]
MFRPGGSDNPDGSLCSDGGQIGDDLPEMVMIALFKLVLDDHRVPIPILCNQINGEITG